MKKLLTVLLSLLMVFTLVGCGEKTDNEATGGEEVETAKVNIVAVFPNKLGDKSFSDLVWSGVTNAQAKYGDKIGEVQNVQLGGDASIIDSTLRELCEDGTWDYIVTGTSSMTEGINAVTLEYPDQKFIVYDTQLDYTDGIRSNSVSYMCKQNEGSYLAGVLAASLTSDTSIAGINEEKVVGFIGGKEGTSIQDFLVGYIQGMQSVDTECKLLFSIIGNFTDAAKAKELAEAQFKQGADVIFGVCSGAAVGIYEAAEEANGYSMGCDLDQADIQSANYPEMAKHIVTSVVKNFDVVLCDAIGAALDGSLTWGKHYDVSLADGGIGICENSYYDAVVTDAIKAAVKKASEDVSGGVVVVDTAYGMDPDVYAQKKGSVLLNN